MKTPFILCLLLIPASLFAQSVAIDNTSSSLDASNMLDVQRTTKGILIPKMTMSNRDAIISPASGLMIYQTNSNPGF
jgi:hypothetical protein